VIATSEPSAPAAFDAELRRIEQSAAWARADTGFPERWQLVCLGTIFLTPDEDQPRHFRSEVLVTPAFGGGWTEAFQFERPGFILHRLDVAEAHICDCSKDLIRFVRTEEQVLLLRHVQRVVRRASPCVVGRSTFHARLH
jgi:hypothetical protein